MWIKEIFELLLAIDAENIKPDECVELNNKEFELELKKNGISPKIA